VDLLDLLDQPRVRERPIGRRAPLPIVKARAVSPPTRGTSPTPESSPSPPRSTRTLLLRLAGLPREKSCRLLENLPLHPQRLILTPQPHQLLPLIRREPVRTFARSSACLTQLRNVTSEIPRSSAICRWLLLEIRASSIASRRNSSGYGGLVRPHFSPPGPRPSTKALRCPRNRGHSTSWLSLAQANQRRAVPLVDLGSSRDGGSLGTTSGEFGRVGVGAEMLMHQADGSCTVAYGRGDAFDRVPPDVACCEHACHARLER
jgi:hypothetical protein